MNPSDDDDYEPTISIGPGGPAAHVPAPEVFGHYLVALAGAEVGKRVELGEAPMTIGRDAKQTLVFADTELSRLHARVSVVNGEVVAEDMKSTNGTFVDGTRISGAVTLRDGQVLRVGAQFLAYERRSRKDIERVQELDRDLKKASTYVLALLPAPLTSGPVRAEWRFIPSTQLGGDAFGYDWLDPNTFIFYLVDVSGHGAGSAMHSVTVLNVLRQRALPGIDFRQPAQVLSSLNDRFQMDSHNGMYFTMWYGVYRVDSRTLTYGSAGHHPAYLVPPDRQTAQPLGMSALMIGAFPDIAYKVQEATLPPASALYLFSDGVFEVITKDAGQWGLQDFLPILTAPAVPGLSETDRIHQAVAQAARLGPLDDDFSLMVVTFP